ncbi:nickel ABC transporter permease [Cohnella lupini]|uniref:Nickel import system permease protein NikB n=1 Tax=Cohnella lupini TaxID=1294267 RepID=A0A3D9IP35_9BACL|nr:nickel ABC transporter permease [Cohnella lupini]RED63269.1 peptide/nickel transport system permease protein/nickel transport system permease protein [Cohnella lupini]
MLKFVLRRLLHTVPVLFGISILSFGLLSIAPGDPAEILLRSGGIQPSEEEIVAVRAEMGLDKPIYVQYGLWLWRLLHLDLGISYSSGRPVISELLDRFPATIALAASAVTILLIIALPLGVASAKYPGSWIDIFGRILTLISASMPGFWIGLLFIYYGAVRLKLFPVTGMDGFSSVWLPALTLGFGMCGTYIRLIRAGMLEALRQSYVRSVRARGIKESVIVGSHALRNAFLPVLTLFGVQCGHLLGGSVVVETIFAWPGIGKYAIDAIFMKDYIVIQGYVLLMALIVVAVNFLVDIGYTLLDPRIRLGKSL